MYDILIKYQTGDSEKMYPYENLLGGRWESLELVNMNVQRIYDHYIWIIRGSWDSKCSKPDFMSMIKNEKLHDHCVPLVLDNGETWQITAEWCGMFSSLDSVEAVIGGLLKLEI